MMTSSTYGKKWYVGGLHFECLQCGGCCSGPGEGYIWASRKEVEFIADYLKLTEGEFRRRYTKRAGLRTTIIEDPASKDCVFLEKGSGSTEPCSSELPLAGVVEVGQIRCAIYPVRPNQCRTWPFWSSNLNGPYAWNSTVQKCPGINRGRGCNIEQIERIRKSRKWW